MTRCTLPAPAIAVLALSACGYVDMSTAARLGSMSPLTADPADFTIYLDIPEGVELPAGSAKLGFGGTRSDTGERLSAEYVLDARQLPDGTRVYRIAEADLAPMRMLQAEMRQWKAEVGRAASGTLSVAMTPCLSGDTLDPDAPVNVDLALEDGGTPMPLIKDLPISEFLEQTESGNFLPCSDL